MSNKELKIDDLVMMASNHNWGSSDANPLNVVGTVCDFDGKWFFVDWSNGTTNAYRVTDNDLVKVGVANREPQHQDTQIQSDMPTSGQFVAVWCYKGSIWSNVFKWDGDRLYVYYKDEEVDGWEPALPPRFHNQYFIVLKK